MRKNDFFYKSYLKSIYFLTQSLTIFGLIELIIDIITLCLEYESLRALSKANEACATHLNDHHSLF